MDDEHFGHHIARLFLLASTKTRRRNVALFSTVAYRNS